jgi:hypothetical protein
MSRRHAGNLTQVRSGREDRYIPLALTGASKVDEEVVGTEGIIANLYDDVWKRALAEAEASDRARHRPCGETRRPDSQS